MAGLGGVGRRRRHDLTSESSRQQGALSLQLGVFHMEDELAAMTHGQSVGNSKHRRAAVSLTSLGEVLHVYFHQIHASSSGQVAHP
jgi:hypothetical protein